MRIQNGNFTGTSYLYHVVGDIAFTKAERAAHVEAANAAAEYLTSINFTDGQFGTIVYDGEILAVQGPKAARKAAKLLAAAGFNVNKV